MLQLSINCTEVRLTLNGAAVELKDVWFSVQIPTSKIIPPVMKQSNVSHAARFSQQ